MSPPSDRSFEGFESAAALADKPADGSTPIPYDQGSFDVHFTYPIASPDSVFKIQTHVAADLGSGAKLTVRYLPRNDESRAMIINSGSEPAALNPAWYHAASGFTMLGIEHILTGFDHLLFLFCLVIPFRHVRGLITVITAFTLAHSVTLFASAFHVAPQGAWFPPFVEMAIAGSIVYTAIENIMGANLRRRWLVAGGFGLVHGFGFSNALGQSLQFAGFAPAAVIVLLQRRNRDRPTCRIGHHVACARPVPPRGSRAAGIIVLSAIVAVIGCYWFAERWQVLRQSYGPSADAQGLISVAQWAIVLVACVAAGL